MTAVPLAISGAAADLVVRARLGEQNAVAMIQEIAKAAARGVERAKQTVQALREYIASHPAKPLRQVVTIGAEDAQTLSVLREVPEEAGALLGSLREGLALWAAVIVLANGPPITADRVGSIKASLEGDAHAAFVAGVTIAGDPSRGACPEFRVGRIFGRAFQLQQVRRPSTPVAHYSAAVAWELGES